MKPHGSQEKRSSGTRSGTVAILVIRQVNCMLKKTNSALRMGIREHEETLMGLATAYMFLRHLKP